MFRWLRVLPVVLIAMMLLAGCGWEEDDLGIIYTLAIDVEGEGTVTPARGSHRCEENTVIPLKASPADGWQFKEWVGEVDDNGSQETTVKVDGDKTVKAVFVISDATAPSPDEPAYVHMIFEVEGFRSEFTAWNCSGLEGEWQLRSEFEMLGYGKLYGEATFTMPQRPASGSWDSLPFSYTQSGTFEIEGATVDITNAYENVVFTIIELEGPTIMDARATGTTTVVVSAPGAPPVEYSESYSWVSDAPFSIIFERHPEC